MLVYIDKDILGNTPKRDVMKTADLKKESKCK